MMRNRLRLVMAQVNFVVGDIKNNAKQVIHYTQYARDKLDADLIVFPELTLTGYPPKDLLLRPDLSLRVQKALTQIQQATHQNKTRPIDIVVGYPQRIQNQLMNTVAVIRHGEVMTCYHKQYLPNYSVFDEKRYFQAGKSCSDSRYFKPFELNGVPISLCICEDLWHLKISQQAAQAGAKILLCINGSPFDINKSQKRQQLVKDCAIKNGLFIVYVNWVGGQDALVFDGDSMAVNSDGLICQHAGYFKDHLVPVDFELTPELHLQPSPTVQETTYLNKSDALIYQALVMGLHDYVKKNQFEQVILGLSGGIDSALTLVIAVDALGKDKVKAYMLPSRYTSTASLEDAEALAKKLGVQFDCIAIEPIFQALNNSLPHDYQNANPDDPDIAEENMQARCRALILMTLSNKMGGLVLSTGNKSEMAVGYCTLYGDTVGGFSVLKDVLKTRVYQLAYYRNACEPVIPQRILDRPPSAELAPNQKDQDSLPPYDVLDAILEGYIEQDQSVENLIAAGFEEAVVKDIIRRVDRNEYKRRQAPPGTRITGRDFDLDRRYPVTFCYNGGGGE